MVMMYHAQEKIVNVPGSQMTGNRGGIHNLGHAHRAEPDAHDRGYAQSIL